MSLAINTVDTGLNGSDGPYPDVTTVGLRNLTGVVNDDGTVTLWATTATTSASGDSGADPNKVVQITDNLAATTMTDAVTQETLHDACGADLWHGLSRCRLRQPQVTADAGFACC